MSFVDKIKSSQAENLFLVGGQEEGREAWYYVLVDKNKVPMFEKELEPGKPYDLRPYGKILYSGWGKEPPEEIKEKVKKEFGG